MPRNAGLKRTRSVSRQQAKPKPEVVDLDTKSDIVDSEEATPKKKVRWGGGSSSLHEDDNTNGENESTDSVKVCLTASCQHGRIGCAYYDPVKCLIYVLEDTQESAHFDVSKLLLDQCNPDIVMTSSKADDGFITVLQNYMEASGNVFQIRPHKEFIPNKGRDRLLSLRFLSELDHEETACHPSSDTNSSVAPQNAYDFMQRRREAGADPTAKRWNAAIRLANFAALESSPLCISSIGALLDHLSRIRAASEFDDTGIEGLDVRGIEALTLDQVMHINADALFSLQIFENENHASIHSDKTKEGLSLFGTLDGTRTSLGRSLLRTWLLRPSLSLQVISARHDAIECFIHPENMASTNALHTHLKGIKNVPRTLSQLRSGKAGVTEWQGLVKFTYHSAMLRDALAELYQAEDVEVVTRLIAVMDIGSFKQVGNAVNETIDWEESAIAGRVCVRPHIDEELDKRKHVYNGIDGVLSKVAEQICHTIPPDYAPSLNVVYFPQLGFLICIPMLDEWKTGEGITVLEGWTFQSQEMYDMDSHIGDLHPSIVDREIEIIQELLDRILVYDQSMSNACDVCAELDCLLAFADVSRGFNYRRPRMVEEPIIEIIQGRHPLQEQVTDTFVPNDSRLVGGVGLGKYFERDDEYESSQMGLWNSVVLCTGANACGKSVYLKQVALIQYMAQIGCFVPAEAATLGIVDKIFTRIQTRESVSKVQSAFMIDTNQVSLALRNCTARSLVLLDEFGKGTISTGSLLQFSISFYRGYGAGLFCGVLKHLLKRGAGCPKVLAATHFHEVFRKDLFDPKTLPVTFLHMQVMFTSGNGELLGHNRDTTKSRLSRTSAVDDEGSDAEDEFPHKVTPGEKITYLYRVAPGLSLNSHAAQCAAMFGVPRRVVERAHYVSQLLAAHELGDLLEEDMTADEQKDLEDAETICRRFLTWDLQSDEATEQTNVKDVLAMVLGRDK
ncbi:DNA mismatch repair protein MutS [Hygrophoropsis aurantiaca]|uniref:DNA mismatch repair protein MutS n=1 Tax=Hygrophoropsis aurantiaca TaxID=72124 RepID=A0ACB8AQA8_9AGAM|nr:DNA mismatch repair protein MutS [Hygrophoropsis aurantiaca]